MSNSKEFRWKSISAKTLCESTGHSDPREAIRFRSHQLIQQVGIAAPPFSPYILGLRLGITRVVRSPMGFDACLLPTADGYEVRICSEHNRTRQNFSMAHEIGHVFFFEVTGKPRKAKREIRIGMNDPDREEEFLCDYAASELIMPSSYFFRDVRYVGPSLGAVFELARRYQASLRATVIKFAEMSLWKCAFFFWRLRREGNKSEFHLESCTRHGDLREGVSLSHKHLLTTLESGQIVRGKEQVKIRNLEETCYVESVRIGSSSSSRVLSMIFADSHARHLAYASNQNLEQPIRQRRLFEDNDDSN